MKGAATSLGIAAVVAVAALATGLLPAPPATPPAVPRTDGFVPFAAEGGTHEDALYPRLDPWVGRGSTEWRLDPASTAVLRLHVDLEQVELAFDLSGSLQLDAARPGTATGGLVARAPDLHRAAIADLLGSADLQLVPNLESLATPPRPHAGAVRSTWAWSLAGMTVEGPVDVSRTGPDRLRLKHAGGLPLNRSAPEHQPARERLARSLGGGLVGEEPGLELDLHLTR